MLKNIHRPALSILLLLITIHSSATTADTLKTKKDSTLVSYFFNDFEKFGNLRLHSLDTAITGYQNYDPLLLQSAFHESQGNIGQASRNLIPYPFLTNSGFDYGIHTLDGYLYQNDSVKYYRVLKTFTELRYEQGAKKETYFRAVFSRNIYRSLNLGFDFKVMNVPGAYLRQRTNHINFVATLQFFTKNKRYGVIANFLLNRLKINENGGIKYDSIFEQHLEKNRQIYAIKLEQAGNRVRENGFCMKHYLDLSRHPKNQKDSAFLAQKHVELGKLVYSFQYNRQVQNYIDYKPNSGFYQDILLDSTLTYDSITVNRIVNELSWSNPSFGVDKKFRLLQIEARIKQQYVEVKDHTLRNFFIQYIPSAAISFHPFSSLFLTAHGDYVFGDYNEGDLSLKVNLSQTLGNPQGKNAGTITLKGNYAFQKPGWFYEHYVGNNFRWDTAWQKQSLVSGCFEYAFRNILTTGISISRIDHHAYLDSTIRPSQYNKEFGYIYAYLNGNLDIGRFKFTGQFAFQTIQGASVLRLPAFLGNLTVYYTQPLFHGAAILQPGLNFNYNTAYYADNYMPALRSYYLQHNKEVGNYLYMDIFVNVKIQRARFFVEYTHFNASFMGRTYYTVPSYPMQDAAFHFGIAWRFHD
ncbi:MAG: hypothetical protein D4R88_01510 [Methanosarcinales archaeon]|nr:MAG: hypothetical protein D4R88_01510 [Methanosarcinales archaeon]